MRPVLCRPFVGRREELAYLNERRLQAAASHGGLVLIGGDAGVGKSRLISHFCSSLAHSRWRIASGPCNDSASRPYGPILDVLARLDEAPFAFDPAATKREQQAAIVDRFAALAARRAIAIVIEDVHWADAATLDLLAYLGPSLERMRMLVLASFRTGDLPPDHPASAAVARIERSARAGRIDLGPLRGQELRRFIDEACAGVELSAETRRAVALAGEGNPFFTEELLKSAVESTAGATTTRPRRELPQTVRATLLERLRPFSEGEREVVTQAAVIGRTFGLELLAATLETQPATLLPTLRRARHLQLIEEVTAGTFRFRHGLTRDAIYADFLGAELRPRHRAIALALEAAEDPPLAALAFHWWAAGDGPLSARYNESAGDEAVRVHAHEDAIALYERALESPELAALARGSLLEKIAGCRAALKFLSEAYVAFTAAADAFREAGAYAREAVCRSNAAIWAYQTSLPHPTAPLEAMLARLDASEYLARSRVQLGLAWLTATFWFPTQAAHHLAHVDPRARAEQPDIALRVHNVAAWVAMTVGDVAVFRREHAAWVAAAEAMNSVQARTPAHCNGGMIFSFFALHEEALEQLERTSRIARDARFFNAEESAHSAGVLAHLLRGDLERARAELIAVQPATESRYNSALASAWGTLVAAHLDDRDLIETWFDGFEADVWAAPEIEHGAGFAEIMVRRGRQRDAEALLHKAIPDCEMVRGNVFTFLAAGRYGRPGDRVRARAYLARAADAPVETPERPALLLFDAIVSEREGRVADARAFARDAADGFGRLRIPLLEAAARETAGDRDGALALYRRCGATYDVRRLTATAESSSASVLSPRESEVALLAAEGRPNLEIAQTLSITHKTVEKHLASIYRKLDISSRARLGTYFAREARKK